MRHWKAQTVSLVAVGAQCRLSAPLPNAQHDVDLRPELYRHDYKSGFPDRFHPMMDTRRWGPGERIVFEPIRAKCLSNRSTDPQSPDTPNHGCLLIMRYQSSLWE